MTGGAAPAADPARDEPPLRLTRRGLVRSVQLLATAGVLGSVAVSCATVDRAGRPARSGRSAAPGTAASRSTGSTGSSGSTAPGGGAAGVGVASPAAEPSTSVAPTVEPAAATPVPALLPGVGASWTARLAGHDQIVLVSGPAMGTTRNTVRWFDRTAAGWVGRAAVAGWNGQGGWTLHHSAGDLRSPVGLYDLTDAGGFSRNPGTTLPYQWSPAEYSEVLNGVRTFDHVLAIDYNRVVGTPPSDSTRPQGWSKGGSIWFHVAHRSPTEACIGIADADLVDLLRWLRPAARPAVLMGPAGVLST